MEILKAFENTDSIELKADLCILKKNLIEISFSWKDRDDQIIFPKAPESGRHLNLWQQTCFEAFIRTTGEDSYFEINFSINGAWNVYHFQGYRMPQPPKEFPTAELVEFLPEEQMLKAKFLMGDSDLSHSEVSLCAVLLLNDGRTGYWSTRHAVEKPDFHHPDSFSLERKKK